MPLHGVLSTSLPPPHRWSRHVAAGAGGAGTPLTSGDPRAALAAVRGLVALLSGAACACEPTVIVAALVCPEATVDAGTTPNPSTPVALPWTTGFERGFCDYSLPSGFCFATGSGSYSVVTSPVHSGHYAAAFSVRSDLGVALGGSQARCVQQGVFPAAAYYGAWYYVPAPAVNGSLWNLLHFQGGVPGQMLHGLWDVSLVNLSDGGLQATVFDFLKAAPPGANTAPAIPIGRWFHVEVYFKRSKDATGQISMWQDGMMAANLTNLVTDDTDWGQWYVGNLANFISPPASTVYVDDVTIGAGP